jgi:hypothetical protein
MGVEYVVKVADPVLTNGELSEAVGRLEAKIESLRSDLVSLEGVVSGRPSIKRKVKAWLRERLAE